ncbi:hypothetical protein [Senegalimassilia anaerobia]
MITYDVQTKEAAQKLYAEIIGGDTVDEKSHSRLEEAFRCQEIQLVCRHLTSSFDECSSIKENGLFGWSEVLRDSSAPLSVVLARHGAYGVDGRIERCDGNKSIDLTSERGLPHLLVDDCVSAYLYCGQNNECYSDSPEILRSLKRKFPWIGLSEEVKHWEENAKPYCVEFSVSPSEVDVITDCYSAEEDDESDIYAALSWLLLDIIASERPSNHPVILKRGVSIPAGQLSVFKLSDMDWDFAME